MSANDLLVEMPPAFDVAGDTGSIGRFSAVSGGSNTSVEMDIKGDTGRLKAALLFPSRKLTISVPQGPNSTPSPLIMCCHRYHVQCSGCSLPVQPAASEGHKHRCHLTLVPGWPQYSMLVLD